MGVSGAGKTTIGAALAERLGVAFVDADDFHSAANRAKLAAGTPLTDADRAPWLDAIHAELGRHPGGWVLACSALKQVYRDVLLAGFDDARVVLLTGSRAVLAERLRSRLGHFANPAILESQLETLERPDDAMVIDVSGVAADSIDDVLRALRDRAG